MYRFRSLIDEFIELRKRNLQKLSIEIPPGRIVVINSPIIKIPTTFFIIL